MSKSNSRKYQGENHKGPSRNTPYPVSRMSPSFGLVDLAREIEEADEQIAQHLNGKLKLIADQIRQLQDQAKSILDNAHSDQLLHRAKCNFKRIPGKIYHLYQKPDNNLYFSMLSPQEWGNGNPDLFKGSYRLETDMSWTPAEDIPMQDKEDILLKNILTLK